MKTLLIVLSLAGAGAVFAAPATAPAGGSEQDWQSYRTKAHQELDAVEARIAALETGARRDGARVRRDAAKEIKAARAQKTKADRQLVKLESAAEKQRSVLEVDLERNIAKLKKTLTKLERRLSNPPPK